MRLSGFDRYMVTGFLATVMLVGCGGSQAPIGAPGAMPQSRATEQYAERGTSWMLPKAQRHDLVYVASGSSVAVFDYKTKTQVGQLSGFGSASALCVDKQGDVWVADYYNDDFTEFAHGGATPLQIIASPAGAFTCSIDPVTGDLAATWFTAYDLGIYNFTSQAWSTYSTEMNTTDSCAYNEHGDLLIGGTVGNGSGYYRQVLRLLRTGSDAVERIKGFPGERYYSSFSYGPALASDGEYWVVKNGSSYYLWGSIAKHKWKTGGAITVTGLGSEFFAVARVAKGRGRANVMFASEQYYSGNLEVYDYPQGGQSFASLPYDGPVQGIAVSRASGGLADISPNPPRRASAFNSRTGDFGEQNNESPDRTPSP